MIEPTLAPSANKWKDGRAWSWAILVCVLVFTAGIRFRLRDMPLERDEGEYAYAGQLLLQGIPPWQLVYTMKFPGTSAAYAVLMSLFGQSCAGIHLGFLTVNGANIVLMFWLARQLAGPMASWVAAATYALMSLSGDALGTAGHATHFVVLCALAGMIMLWRASEKGGLASFFASGLLLSLGVLMKQNGIAFAAFGATWLVWIGCSRRVATTGPYLKSCAAFFAGLAIPFLITVLLLWRAGVLGKFWFWTFEYARTYGMRNPGLDQVWRWIMQRMPAVEKPAFYASLIGLVTLWSRRKHWPVAVFATGLVFWSLVATVPGFHFRPHYFVLLMPAFALLTGIAVQQAAQMLGGCGLRILSAVPVCAFCFFFVEGVAREKNLFFQLSPLEACRFLYGSQPFPESITIAEYIREHSPPDARIAVLGSEPQIYFYAHRRSATGYIYTYPLMERQPFALQMRQEMYQEIEAAKPMFLVQVRSWTSWLSRPGSPALIEETCNALTPPDYELVGSADVTPTEPHVEWHWDEEALKGATNAVNRLLIFRYKAPPSALR